MKTIPNCIVTNCISMFKTTIWIMPGLYELNRHHKTVCHIASTNKKDSRLSPLAIRKTLLVITKWLWIWERESEQAWASRGGAGRETLMCLCTISAEPNVGLELTNHEITTWVEVGCLINRTTQVPLPSVVSFFFFFKCPLICERERKSTSRGGAKREGDYRIWSRLQSLSNLSAQSPTRG